MTTSSSPGPDRGLEILSQVQGGGVYTGLGAVQRAATKPYSGESRTRGRAAAAGSQSRYTRRGPGFPPLRGRLLINLRLFWASHLGWVDGPRRRQRRPPRRAAGPGGAGGGPSPGGRARPWARDGMERNIEGVAGRCRFGRLVDDDDGREGTGYNGTGFVDEKG